MRGQTVVQSKVDSKGRICPPSEFQDEIVGTVVVTRTSEGLLTRRSKKKDFLEEFRNKISSEPERTGEPENWPPEKMKKI